MPENCSCAFKNPDVGTWDKSPAVRKERDLRDDTWMIREGLGEMEREHVLRSQSCERKRYQISNIPYLGTDVKVTLKDIVPKPKLIYEDDSDYIKLCKRGGHKDLLWNYSDYPLDPEPEKDGRLMRPKPAEWSVHPTSLLPSAHEEFLKNRKLPLTAGPRIDPEKPKRLDPTKLPVAKGKSPEYSWEPGLRHERPCMYKIVTNGYLESFQKEVMKRHYFESLFDRPNNEEEKLQISLLEAQRVKTMLIREKAARYDRMKKGLPSWSAAERAKMQQFFFPHGPGRGCRAPPPSRFREKQRTDSI